MNGMKMTAERRREILSKEVLELADIAELTGFCKSVASEYLQRAKRQNDILGVKGKILTADYLRFIGIDPTVLYALKDRRTNNGGTGNGWI